MRLEINPNSLVNYIFDISNMKIVIFLLVVKLFMGRHKWCPENQSVETRMIVWY